MDEWDEWGRYDIVSFYVDNIVPSPTVHGVNHNCIVLRVPIGLKVKGFSGVAHLELFITASIYGIEALSIHI